VQPRLLGHVRHVSIHDSGDWAEEEVVFFYGLADAIADGVLVLADKATQDAATALAEQAGRFRLGTLVWTPGFQDLAEQARKAPGEAALELLQRYVRGDWGEMPPEDQDVNDAALGRGGRLMAAYRLDGERVWVVTGVDRAVTTLLLPIEY
jgi:hypothetical protein